MPKNKIEDLRNLLFETMERLMDDDDVMDVERAEAVGRVGQVIVNSAKAEIAFVKQTGHGGTSFIPAEGPRRLNEAPKPIALGSLSPNAHADLCTKCPLPECNEQSPDCLIQIERRAA